MMLTILVNMNTPFMLAIVSVQIQIYNMRFVQSSLWYKGYLSTPFQLLTLFVLSFCLKMTLVPAYFSTDQDVHQNWLRITATKPLEEWYYDTESQWTLDYPPLFAFFQYILSSFSVIICPGIANSINQMRFTVYYQRATVMFSEIPYLLVLFWIFKEINRKLVIAYFAIPFIILDNIHFQYNIIMQAIFLGSIQLIRKGSYLKGAFVYAILLNFKHIYLYSALAFFAYILKEYVLRGQSIKQKVTSLCKVAIATIIPFLISFLPFILKGGVGQIGQIMSRLFPFQRGLIHDYWAPNFWALYYFLDKLLNLIFSKLGLQPITIRQASQLHSLTNLPQIPAALTTLIILLATLPLLYVYFKNKRIRFEYLVFLCGSIFFMFGFHVHQKAITPYIGLLLVFSREEEEQQQLVDSAVFVNIVNLLPLLLQPNQKLLRMVVPLLWLSIWERKRQLSYALEFSVVAGGLGVVAFHQMLHPLIFRSRMEFLPLMLNSLYSSVFNLSWIFKLYHQQLTKIQQKDEYNSLPSSSLEQ